MKTANTKPTKTAKEDAAWLPLGTGSLVHRPWGDSLVLDLADNPAARRLEELLKNTEEVMAQIEAAMNKRKLSSETTQFFE